MKISIAGFGEFDINYLIFDLNGTLAIDGEIPSLVQEEIKTLKKDFEIVIVSRDIHGNVSELAKSLGVQHRRISGESSASEQKANIVKQIGGQKVISIGNGNSDRGMFAESAISIAVAGPEGASFNCIKEADIVVKDIYDALECIKKPIRIIATLQN